MTTAHNSRPTRLHLFLFPSFRSLIHYLLSSVFCRLPLCSKSHSLQNPPRFCP